MRCLSLIKVRVENNLYKKKKKIGAASMYLFNNNNNIFIDEKMNT